MNGERTVVADDDSGLIARFLRGDAAAFDTLFLKYQDYVYHIIYGIVGSAEEARDLTQEVFVQVYRSLPKFRQGARFATWLYRIAMNRAVDSARGARRWRFLPILSETTQNEYACASEEEPQSLLARGVERDAVQTVLMRCPLGHRQALVLRYYRELSLEEIAETLGCSLAAAKVRLHRARQVFRENYLELYGAEEGNAATKEGADAEQSAR